jgi:hypothetical protein
MARNARADKPIRRIISLPESLDERLNLHLHSKLQGRVPYGARNELIAELVIRYLDLIESTEVEQ